MTTLQDKVGQNHRYEGDIVETLVHQLVLGLRSSFSQQEVQLRWLCPKETHYLGKRESLTVSKLPSTGGAFSALLKGASAVL